MERANTAKEKAAVDMTANEREVRHVLMSGHSDN